ncbi:hypothetical protein BRC96_04195 [Halobacteriales archaeon QS_6_64_34]|nr:MAG: hypothetical protein BRC96_04195 [Halobacteriales archaeon QS_6_64_34]
MVGLQKENQKPPVKEHIGSHKLLTIPEITMEIDIRYDDELRKKVRDGATDPPGWVDVITCGETDLTGDSDDGMKEYLTSFFTGLLQGLEECTDGERTVFRTVNGPIYVVLEPLEGEAIRVWFCYRKNAAETGGEPEPYEPAAIIGNEELVQAVVEAAGDFLEFVEDVNPELVADSYDYQGLREDIEAVRKRYELN